MSIGWNWGYQKNRTHHNTIKHNHVHHVVRGVLSDGGGIYTLGIQTGTVVRNNRFHDIFPYMGKPTMAWGIYLDQASSGLLIENNIHSMCKQTWTFRADRVVSLCPSRERRTRPMRTKTDFASVWQRIERHAGETFHQKRGGEFRYEVKYGTVLPDRTNRALPKSHFEQAHGMVPLENTVPVQHLQGPSYLYAILMDRRISEGYW